MRIAGNIARYTVRPGEDVVAETKQPPPQEMMPSWQVAEQFVHLLCNLDGRSIQTHITSLDRAIGGLERQTLTVLCARPGMGKTALAWQIARNVAAAGNKVCFFSLEMGAANLWARASCGALGLRWRDVRGGNVAPQDLDRLATTARTLAGKYGGALLLSDRTVDTPQIMQLIEHHHPDLVVVDHIRLLADRNDSEVKRLGLVTQRLKEVAKAFDCSVLALAQLNRGVEGRDNKRPTLADLRDSGEIEENADLVLALYRPDYYAPEAGPVVVSDTEVLVRKFRDDVNAQKIVLQFDPARQWFDARVMPARSSGSNGRQPEPEYEPVSA